VAGATAQGLGTTVKWAALLGVLLVVVIVIVAVVALGSEADKRQQSAAQLTPAKLEQVELGIRKGELRELLGAPERADRTQLERVEQECWYDGVLAETTWQFCFENGRLASRNRSGGEPPG
jgi:hypothetical protein